MKHIEIVGTHFKENRYNPIKYTAPSHTIHLMHYHYEKYPENLKVCVIRGSEILKIGVEKAEYDRLKKILSEEEISLVKEPVSDNMEHLEV